MSRVTLKKRAEAHVAAGLPAVNVGGEFGGGVRSLPPIFTSIVVVGDGLLALLRSDERFPCDSRGCAVATAAAQDRSDVLLRDVDAESPLSHWRGRERDSDACALRRRAVESLDSARHAAVSAATFLVP